MTTSLTMRAQTLPTAAGGGYAVAVSIETPEELEGLRASGLIVAEVLRAMRRAVRPGVTTGDLDAIAARIFRRAGARSAPQLTYGFPGATSISVNDEAVHGIPGPRRLREGDLVKLDVTVEPIVSTGSGALRQSRDGWTVSTADGALCAQEEHTIVITSGAPLVLTA